MPTTEIPWNTQAIHHFETDFETQIDALTQHTPNTLKTALKYSVLKGGKRFRAQLVYASAQFCHLPIEHVRDLAMAIELLHSYSLVHDDLPAMDDDALRRNQPSCHIAFTEATAILVGDALQSMAFEVLTHHTQRDPHITLKLIQHLARAVGPNGMVAGQYLDLHAPANTKQAQQHQYELKTGALFQACLCAPTALMGNSETVYKPLTTCAYHLGLAYQHQDDAFDQDTRSPSPKTHYEAALQAIQSHPHHRALSQCIEAIQQRTH